MASLNREKMLEWILWTAVEWMFGFQPGEHILNIPTTHAEEFQVDTQTKTNAIRIYIPHSVV